MTPLTPTKLIAVVVPQDAKELSVYDLCYSYVLLSDHEERVIDLPEGRHSLVGTITKEAVFDFDAGKYAKDEADFLSILESNGVYLNNPMGEKPNERRDFNKYYGRTHSTDMDAFDREQFNYDVKKWQSYESKTVPQGHKLLIIERL